MFQTKVVEKIKTHFTFNKYFFPENLTIYEILWEKNMVKPDRPHDNTMRRMRLVFWITNATDTYSEYAILISFPLQQWLRERSSILGSKHGACLVSFRYKQSPPKSAFPDICILCHRLPSASPHNNTAGKDTRSFTDL